MRYKYSNSFFTFRIKVIKYLRKFIFIILQATYEQLILCFACFLLKNKIHLECC